jgi:hypothetical protein
MGDGLPIELERMHGHAGRMPVAPGVSPVVSQFRSVPPGDPSDARLRWRHGNGTDDGVRRIEAEALVRAAPQRVWDLYADVHRSAAWVPFVEEVLWVEGEPGVGQRYRERTRLLGTTDEAEWQIVEWDPPRRQVQRSDEKGMTSHLAIEVETSADGARVRQIVTLQSRLPRPIAWYHEALFAVVGGHGIRSAVRAAKRHLESELDRRA